MMTMQERAEMARAMAGILALGEGEKSPKVNKLILQLTRDMGKEDLALLREDTKKVLQTERLGAKTIQDQSKLDASLAKLEVMGAQQIEREKLKGAQRIGYTQASADEAIRVAQAKSGIKIGEAAAKESQAATQAARIGGSYVKAYKMAMKGPHAPPENDPALKGIKAAIMQSGNDGAKAGVYVLEQQAGAQYQQRMATTMADLTQKAQAAGIADVSSLGIPVIAKRAVEGDPGVVADFGKAVNEAKRMNAIRSAGEQLEAAKVVRPELLKKFTDQLAAKATTEAEVGALSGGIKAALMGEEAALARTGKMKKAGLGGAAALLAIPILKSIFSKNEPEKMSPQMQMMLAQQLSQGTAGGEGSLETGRTINNMTKLLALIKTVQGMSGMMGDQQAPLSRLV